LAAIGVRLSWFAIIAMPIALFCLVDIRIMFKTIHAGHAGGAEGRVPVGPRTAAGCSASVVRAVDNACPAA